MARIKHEAELTHQNPNTLDPVRRRRFMALSDLASRIEGLHESDPRLHALWQVQMAAGKAMESWDPLGDQQLLLALIGEDDEHLAVSTDDALLELIGAGIQGIQDARHEHTQQAVEHRVKEEVARQVDPLRAELDQAQAAATEANAEIERLEPRKKRKPRPETTRAKSN